jgi:KaiC
MWTVSSERRTPHQTSQRFADPDPLPLRFGTRSAHGLRLHEVGRAIKRNVRQCQDEETAKEITGSLCRLAVSLILEYGRTSMPQPDLVRTGIARLDDILPGGIPRGNVILVEAAIGTGKTTPGVEFVYRGASEFNEPGMIVLFEVSPHKLLRDAFGFGWESPAAASGLGHIRLRERRSFRGCARPARGVVPALAAPRSHGANRGRSQPWLPGGSVLWVL